MSSSTATNSNMSRPTPPSTLPTGARKIKVAPGSQIKSMFTSLIDEAKGASNSPPPASSNAARRSNIAANSVKPAVATAGDRDAVNKVVNKAPGSTTARHATPVARPVENRGDDFELFDDDLPRKSEAHVPHEQSARHNNALSSSGGLPTAKSKIFRKSIVPSAPADVFKSAKKSVVVEEKKKPAVADYEQCLLL
jgi:hypothetical protein